METMKKQVMDIFQKGMLKQFKKYCFKHQMEMNLETLIVYLMDHDFISPATIRRFTINLEFEEMLPQNEFHKTNTVQELSHKLNLTERTIWSALKASERSKKVSVPNPDLFLT